MQASEKAAQNSDDILLEEQNGGSNRHLTLTKVQVAGAAVLIHLRDGSISRPDPNPFQRRQAGLNHVDFAVQTSSTSSDNTNLAIHLPTKPSTFSPTTTFPL